MFFTCRQKSTKETLGLQHQASQIDGEVIQIPIDSQIVKTSQDNQAATTAVGVTAGATGAVNVSANGEVDLGNVDLSQMDPEVIRVINLFTNKNVINDNVLYTYAFD